MTKKEFSRFKYAEEYADKLHSQGKHFIMTNAFDVEHPGDFEGDEPYVYDTFYVEEVEEEQGVVE